MAEDCWNIAGDELSDTQRGPAGSVRLLTAREALDVWPAVRGWIESALEHAVQRDLSTGDIAEGLRTGLYRLLVLADHRADPRAVAVLCYMFREGDQHKYLSLIALGGSALDEWLCELVNACKDIGRRAGCVEILILGRPGWVRVLRPHGLEHRASILRLAL